MRWQDQDEDFALFWTFLGAQMSVFFSAEVNLHHYLESCSQYGVIGRTKEGG